MNINTGDLVLFSQHVEGWPTFSCHHRWMFKGTLLKTLWVTVVKNAHPHCAKQMSDGFFLNWHLNLLFFHPLGNHVRREMRAKDPRIVPLSVRVVCHPPLQPRDLHPVGDVLCPSRVRSADDLGQDLLHPHSSCGDQRGRGGGVTQPENMQTPHRKFPGWNQTHDHLAVMQQRTIVAKQTKINKIKGKG